MMNCETCTGLDDQDRHVYCPESATCFYWDEATKEVRSHCGEHQIKDLDDVLLYGRVNHPGRIKRLTEYQAKRIAKVWADANTSVRSIVDEP